MAHDPLLRWEWEGGATAHVDLPDDYPDSQANADAEAGREFDAAPVPEADPEADRAPEGAEVERSGPAGGPQMRSLRASDRVLPS